MPVHLTCSTCGRAFSVPPSRALTAFYCSRPCQNVGAMVDPDTRFCEKVDRSGSCWLWTAAPMSGGYGAFQLSPGHQVGAHRYAWTMASGEPIPDGLDALHTCDVRPCVRNDDAGVYIVRGVEHPRFGHLWLGTAADNAADMVDKGRSLTGALNPNVVNIGRAPRGERHGCAKLTAEAVLSIRADLADGASRKALAEQHHVTTSLIRRIALRQVWAHI